ncbi:ferrichrome ABC transporter substrate-binding protein [Vitreoscilla sp. C1]|nr:ferrichrome ABC transporter substrate-binding protein [Vitreoscilla sp. C1]
MIALLCLPVLLQAQNIKIISSDWAIVETLVAMGHAPIGVGDKRAYQRWVAQPALPPSTVDIGLRAQPNLELIRQLRPDLVVNSSWFMQLQARAIPNAKSVSIDFFTSQGIEWHHSVAQTRALGKLIGQPAAETLIQQAMQQFSHQSKQLAPHAKRPYAIVQFIDARHLRIYGNNSMYGQALTQLRLRNAWNMPTNAWGFSQIDLLQLSKLPANTRLIVVHPHPANVAQQLQKSALWQRLPYSRSVNQIVLPAVWSFGALPSMQRFGNELTASLNGNKVGTW